MVLPRIKMVVLNHGVDLGGAEIVLLNTLEHLDNTKFYPILVVPQPGPLMERAQNLGIECQVVGLSERTLRLERTRIRPNILSGLLVLPFMWRLANYLKSVCPDIIYTNSTKAHIYGSVVAGWLHIPLIWRLNDVVDASGFHKLVRLFIYFFAKYFPQKILCVSRAVKEPLKKVGVSHEKLHTLYYGLDEVLLKPRSGRNKKGDGSVVIGNIGRLTPLKGQDIFIRAAVALLRRYPHLRFLIVGDSYYDRSDFEKQLKFLVKQSGVEEHVVFTGFVDDIPGFLEDIDILVNTSVRPDAFGMSVLEGMAAGKAVVATDYVGAKEIIESGKNGFILPSNDVSALVDVLQMLIEKPAKIKSLGREARRTVVRDFTLEKYIDQLEEFLIEVVSSRTRPV